MNMTDAYNLDRGDRIRYKGSPVIYKVLGTTQVKMRSGIWVKGIRYAPEDLDVDDPEYDEYTKTYDKIAEGFKLVQD